MRTKLEDLFKIISSAGARTIYSFVFALGIAYSFYCAKGSGKNAKQNEDSTQFIRPDSTITQTENTNFERRARIKWLTSNAESTLNILTEIEKLAINKPITDKPSPFSTWPIWVIGILGFPAYGFLFFRFLKLQKEISIKDIIPESENPPELSEAAKQLAPFFAYVRSPRDYRRMVNKMRLNYAIIQGRKFEEEELKTNEQKCFELLKFMLFLEWFPRLKELKNRTDFDIYIKGAKTYAGDFTFIPGQTGYTDSEGNFVPDPKSHKPIPVRFPIRNLFLKTLNGENTSNFKNEDFIGLNTYQWEIIQFIQEMNEFGG